MAGTLLFWGVEVKSGESLEVKPTDGLIVHLSQACLGESRKSKSNESVYLHLTVNNKKFVLGKLWTEKVPHASFDLVIDRTFTLSHDWKNGSVYFTGYKAEDPYQPDPEEVDKALSGSVPAPNSGTQTVKPNEDVKSTGDSDEESEDESFAEESDSESDEDMAVASDDSSESDEEDQDDGSDDKSSDKIEETPKKAESRKKRGSDSVPKTSVPDKKAKLITPQKTDGKKEAAVNREATPHPSKQAGKGNKPKQQTPKSGGSFSCKSCNRSFTSEVGLESHTKAKHSSGK